MGQQEVARATAAIEPLLSGERLPDRRQIEAAVVDLAAADFSALRTAVSSRGDALAAASRDSQQRWMDADSRGSSSMDEYHENEARADGRAAVTAERNTREALSVLAEIAQQRAR